ncbi:hypothetical protein THOM_1393, partial [Trachipleistophora hominis]
VFGQVLCMKEIIKLTFDYKMGRVYSGSEKRVWSGIVYEGDN